MKFYLFMIVTGIGLFLCDRLLLRLLKIGLVASLLSGIFCGVIFGWLAKLFFWKVGISWFIVPLITLSGSLLLFLFARYQLYQKPLIQVFSTILLGIGTGLLAWLMLELLMLLLPSQPWLFFRPHRFWLEMILLGFLLHFGYAFSVRISKRLIRADQPKG